MSTGDLLGGVGALVIGVSCCVFWWIERRREPSWAKHAYPVLTRYASAPFWRGFLGGQLPIGIGLALLGLMQLVIRPTDEASGFEAYPEWLWKSWLVLGLGGVFLGLVVSWLGRPKFLFPVRVRDEEAPWREALTNLGNTWRHRDS